VPIGSNLSSSEGQILNIDTLGAALVGSSLETDKYGPIILEMVATPRGVIEPPCGNKGRLSSPEEEGPLEAGILEPRVVTPVGSSSGP
jgi:hypothetical protein